MENLSSLKQNIEHLVLHVLSELYKSHYNEYVLLIVRASFMEELKNVGCDGYVVDCNVDCINDETRMQFLLEYLNKNYKSDFLDYTKGDGFFYLNVELMIYCHLWESENFLMLLARISQIYSNGQYDWKLQFPQNSTANFIKTKIIQPLGILDNSLCSLIQEVYSPKLRNAFAHSLYNIDNQEKVIRFHNLKNKDLAPINFNEFQYKFLSSVLLCYYLFRFLSEQRKQICQDCISSAITEPFKLENNKYIQIYADGVMVNGKFYPRFKGVYVHPKM